jgi:hypothetical protein
MNQDLRHQKSSIHGGESTEKTGSRARSIMKMDDEGYGSDGTTKMGGITTNQRFNSKIYA